MARLGIIAGAGVLPGLIRTACPEALTVVLEGVTSEPATGAQLNARFEKIGTLFDDLHKAGVTQLVFAGAMGRPALDPAQFDAKLMSLAPQILPALGGGDDALLRKVIAIFEAEGFAVEGAHEVAPQLLANQGHIAGPEPSEADLQDAARATAILEALAPVDVGQGAVVAGGLCLGIETQQGTDALLDFVARTPTAQRRGARGVLVKRPKAGQDLRVDMPAIGPGTVQAAQAAGLAGIVVAAGQTLVLDAEAVSAAAKDAGLFLRAQ